MNYKNRINSYGRWSLITGGSDGIGRDFAFELASMGQNIILISSNEDKLEKVKNELQKRFKVEVEIYPVDLTKEEHITKVSSFLNFTDIGFVVLAAGFGSLGAFHELDVKKELDMINLNCRAVVELAHKSLNQFRSKGKGGLVLFGSLVGFQGTPWAATYAATKGFVQSFAEAIRSENNVKNIDILCVAPGPVNSGFGNRAGMNMGKAQSSYGIAKKCLAGLGKQTTIRPGFLSKFLGYSLIALPRGMRTFLMKIIMGGMRHGK